MTTPKPPAPPGQPTTTADAETPATTTAAREQTTATSDRSTPESAPATTVSPTTAEPSTNSSTATSTSTAPSSTSETSTATSSEEPTPDPDRPNESGPAALFDAVAAEHAAIYGYGMVSANVMPEQNELVSEALSQHRDRREAALVLMKDQSVKAPLPAMGYRLPMPVNNAVHAAKLAVRMESDCAVAWRAVLEQTESEQDREFAVQALTQCAVAAARWRKVLGAWPVTEAFPGGTE